MRRSYACIALCGFTAACFSDADPTADDGGTAATDPGSSSSQSSEDGTPQPTSDVVDGSGSEAEATSASTGNTDGDGSSTETGPVVDDSGTSTGENPCADEEMFTEVPGCPQVIGQAFCSEGANHVPQDSVVEWMHDPPHSGPHYPTWETWGEHASTVPRGNWVHNLEHGGIVLAYLCPGDSCPEQLDVLREVIAQRPDLRILMTPDPELDGEGFAAISWTWVHEFSEPDLDTLLCFVDQHENHAPEDIP